MKTFTYDRNCFLADGKPYTVISGAMHYFRIPAEYWHDRLLKLKQCGFNTVETYTCWNLHETKEGVFDFSGMLDIDGYLTEAENLGLNVILRPGPYICSEWDMGGLPAWLLNYHDMEFRCFDDAFISKVRRYYDRLLPIVKPHLLSHGGGVIMMQIENEYGSYGNDHDYMSAIADIYHENGIDCLLFTSDGATDSMLSGGTLPGYPCVVNFGSRPADNFAAMERFRADQPKMCGEYWIGWFDHWYEHHHTRDPQEVASLFREMLEEGASLNFYMFHGGTNFGFMNGANYYEIYEPTVTSYDYC
ncbi:MAG: beta-galactosidase, partial [Clostridia bacterium]|nr:beta-galactosidase [Clostridia bacterium]